MSNILITGVTGFIGRAVCKKLREESQVQNDMLTGTTRSPERGAGPERVPLYNIREIGPNTDWSQAISGADIVIHLAARVHIMHDTANDPLSEFRKVNTAGTINLAEQASKAGVRRFIFISTVKVVGEISSDDGFTENSPCKPEDPYSISKWEAEQALKKIAKGTNMEIVILRPPLVYGPGVKGNFATLFNAVLNEKLLPLGAIKNKRSLIYVDNLADAISWVAKHPDIKVQTFFVSDEGTLSTPELVNKIASALTKKPRLINLPLILLRMIGKITSKSSSINRLTNSLVVDTSKINSQIGWRPPFSTKTGLKKTAEWFNSNCPD